jgi:hypothetical protein
MVDIKSGVKLSRLAPEIVDFKRRRFIGKARILEN